MTKLKLQRPCGLDRVVNVYVDGQYVGCAVKPWGRPNDWWRVRGDLGYASSGYVCNGLLSALRLVLKHRREQR